MGRLPSPVTTKHSIVVSSDTATVTAAAGEVWRAAGAADGRHAKEWGGEGGWEVRV